MVKKTRSPITVGKIEFLQFHRPALPSGDYEIESSIETTKPTIAEHVNEPSLTEQKLVEKENT